MTNEDETRTVEDVLHAYGIASRQQVKLVVDALLDEQVDAILAAQSRNDVGAVLGQLAAAARAEGKGYVHP